MSLPKRKAFPSASTSRKRSRTQHSSLSADGLPWKSVPRLKKAGLSVDDGILDLEEVSDVEVVYEENELGRVVKFNLSRSYDRDVRSERSEASANEVSHQEFFSEPSFDGVLIFEFCLRRLMAHSVSQNSSPSLADHPPPSSPPACPSQ